MKLSRSAALGVLAALAVPAAASAHPGVFTTEQRTLPQGATCRMSPVVDTSCLQTNTQYAVGNDGWAMSYTEVHTPPGSAPGHPTEGRGLVNYKFLPGTWRGTSPATADTKKAWLAYAPAETNLQAHATCLDAPWDTPDNIIAYQSDPFYNYIPWQKTSAGLGDDPAKWIPLVKSLTNVDLSALNTEAEFQAACTTAGGTYYKADTAAKITNALETAVKTPLESQITTLTNSLATVTAAKAAVDAQLVAATKPRDLTLTLSAKKFEQGVAMVTGQPGTSVTVRALLSSASAKKLKISRTLSSKKATINAQGAALVNLGLTKKAAKAVDKHLPQLKVTIDATAGTVKQTATGTLTR
jgi:hypothetical protein